MRTKRATGTCTACQHEARPARSALGAAGDLCGLRRAHLSGATPRCRRGPGRALRLVPAIAPAVRRHNRGAPRSLCSPRRFRLRVPGVSCARQALFLRLAARMCLVSSGAYARRHPSLCLQQRNHWPARPSGARLSSDSLQECAANQARIAATGSESRTASGAL